MRTVASVQVADLEELRQEAEERLRRALISAGRVRAGANCNAGISPLPDSAHDAVPATSYVKLHDARLADQRQCETAQSPQDVQSSAAEPVVSPVMQKLPFGATVDGHDSEEDFVPCSSVEQRAEHRWRANLWISETVPKGYEAFHEKELWEQIRDRKAEELRQQNLVMKRLSTRKGQTFQDFVNKRHMENAYNMASCLPMMPEDARRKRKSIREAEAQRKSRLDMLQREEEIIKAHFKLLWDRGKESPVNRIHSAYASSRHHKRGSTEAVDESKARASGEKRFTLINTSVFTDSCGSADSQVLVEKND